jgi:hypothetical protein
MFKTKHSLRQSPQLVSKEEKLVKTQGTRKENIEKIIST